ncbi:MULTISPECIES: hypothetical protein [Calothrix]|uniref:DNA helicase n=2 Tax=Calothrix TaxID=1186 RepID=A0ABR8A807_9CYAN|nr:MULTISPECIES: hypothetical protein [Calothrix]MBD2196018.1 hypothetical protein [Calothrix parietina FACHB-288]MBD2224492.1 hypothetical protein [Calothrix anomala FACHB-343]
MPVYLVKIVRAAVREIQKLPHEYFKLVAEIIKKISEGNLGDYRKLEGYQDLWRTKKHDVRVIWTRNQEEILILIAGQRKDIYKKIVEDRNRNPEIDISDVLELGEKTVEHIPTYEWNPKQINSWNQFVYGGYLYSPVLTQEQKEIFQEVRNPSPNPVSNHSNINSLLLQSAPGTGKTVCAALMACELYVKNYWNIALILPENLSAEIKEFTEIKEILQLGEPNFFVGTFAEWLHQAAPDIYKTVATVSEELQALQAEARKIHVIDNNEDLNINDLILFRGFIAKKHKHEQSNHPIYRENEHWIGELKNITLPKLQQRLGNKKIWIDGVNAITENALPLQQSNTTLFIFDEAQDYLIDEINAIVNMLERWQQDNNHTSILFLLGDMNQRITPIDFNWGHLQLNKRHNLKYNYRNTKYILEFANSFHAFAKIANSGGKKLPEVSQPEYAFEQGEPVRILECTSQEEALQIINDLSDKVRYTCALEQHSILRLLSSQVKLIYQDIPEQYSNLPGLDYIKFNQAKGREFDACVAFCVFAGAGKPSFEEANNWYTIFTRPRYRLLVIATTDEIERIGRLHFQKCQFFNSANADTLDWITEWANGEHLFKDITGLCNIIYEGLSNLPIQIYWDTYAAFRLARIDNDTVTQIEEQAIKILANHSREILYEELQQIQQIDSPSDRIPLQCLLLRALGSSWEAVKVASELQDVNLQEYQDLILRIASTLQQKGLLYEAARVRAKIGMQIPDDFPFRQEISNQEGNLVSLLCNAAIEKIAHTGEL